MLVESGTEAMERAFRDYDAKPLKTKLGYQLKNQAPLIESYLDSDDPEELKLLVSSFWRRMHEAVEALSEEDTAIQLPLPKPEEGWTIRHARLERPNDWRSELGALIFTRRNAQGAEAHVWVKPDFKDLGAEGQIMESLASSMFAGKLQPYASEAATANS